MAGACWWAASILSCALAPQLAAAQAVAATPAPITCAADSQLTEAAAELLLARTPLPSAQALSEAVRAAGSDGVGLHALFVPAGSEPDAEQKWLTTLRSRVDGQLYCGRADNEAGRLLIVLGRGAELAPIDARARIVRGQLHAGFAQAELVIEDGDAQLVRVGVNPDSLRKGIELAPELELPLKVQLVARGPSGPRPVAERQLPAQSERAISEPPNAHTALSRSHVTAAEREASLGASAFDGAAAAQEGQRRAEPSVLQGRAGMVTGAKPGAAAQAFSELVLQLRASRGRSGLRSNRLLREAAEQHAQEVCAKGRVAHEVEAGEGPSKRLARAGLDARVLGEAIARAEDTDSALHALQNSPSHLYTLLDPRFTDFGIGVAKDQAEKFCYVVLLCAWPRYVGKRQ